MSNVAPVDFEATRIRVLLVEDSETDVELILAQLRRAGFAVEWRQVETEADYRQQLDANWDIILADYTLPQFTGLRALRLARQHSDDIPFLMVSGSIGDERAAECVREGAADYVLKDRLGRLGAAVAVALESRRLRRSQAAAERELRAAHETLLESERRYRLLFENNPHPMWVYDVDTFRFLAVNDAAIAHYGYSRDEFLGMTMLDIRPAEDVAATVDLVRGKMEPLRSGGTSRHRRRDGTIVDVEVASHAIDWADHKARVVLVTDVTERMRAEDELAGERALMRMLIDQIPDPVYVKDRASRFVLANVAVTQLVGEGSPAALIGRTDRDFFSAKLADKFRADELRVLDGQPVFNIEEIIPMPNGTERVLLTTKLPLRDSDGNITSLVGIGRDITDRKTLQTELLRAQRFESVGRLASGIAHDMNNILAPIMMAAPMLRATIESPDVEKMISTIEVSARRGAELVRQLLIFGRGVEPGGAPVDVVKVIDELTRIIRETFPRNITVAADVARDLWRIQGGSAQLHQVLLNLCVNARDAMPQGGTLSIVAGNVRLDESEVAPHRGVAPGPFVRLSVADTGSGIPPAIAEKIFDPFFTTKESHQGTGLGLSTVLGIVQGHGGILTFDSAPDRGTVFDVCFPAQLAGDGPREAKEPPMPARGNQEMILVVDDEESIRQVLRDALTRHNYRVVTACDGAEAASVFTAQMAEIRLVIADIDMPHVDGVTLAKVLRRINPSIRILMSTGTTAARSDASNGEREARGAQSVLVKPYTAARVLSAVHEALQ